MTRIERASVRQTGASEGNGELGQEAPPTGEHDLFTFAHNLKSSGRTNVARLVLCCLFCVSENRKDYLDIKLGHVRFPLEEFLHRPAKVPGCFVGGEAVLVAGPAAGHAELGDLCPRWALCGVLHVRNALHPFPGSRGWRQILLFIGGFAGLTRRFRFSAAATLPVASPLFEGAVQSPNLQRVGPGQLGGQLLQLLQRLLLDKASTQVVKKKSRHKWLPQVTFDSLKL